VDELCGLVDPAGIEHGAGVQKHQPRRSRLPGAGRQRRSARPGKRKETASGDIGDALDHAAAGAVHQQHFAHHARRGARHQRRKRGDGGLFEAFGGDDDAQHGRLLNTSERHAVIPGRRKRIRAKRGPVATNPESRGVQNSGFGVCAQARASRNGASGN
jgi:hypothetical protein